MISRLRDGTPVESYDNQAGIIRFLYSTAPGRFLLRPLIRPRFSKFMGHALNSGISRVLVGPFIRKNHISMEDYPPRRYRSFNDFFTRTILPERRPVDPEPEHLIAPCDSKLSAISLEPDTRFYIKGVAYTAGDLLRSEELAKRFAGGWLLLFRLTVDDYHHYLYPLSGTESTRVVIPGVFHTVNPYAAGIRPIYRENTREYTCTETEFGTLLQMEVGALLVGRISNHKGSGPVQRGTEKGMFEFGGSTVVLMLEPGRLTPDEDILRNSSVGEETIVKMGERIGTLIRKS
ncbi:MAG: phosphatidylserine decarboxylase [Oscillospiraceae bacterium]|nr:phosphatidylserine decarboxylase [Oscillospiraceae bacterium]